MIIEISDVLLITFFGMAFLGATWVIAFKLGLFTNKERR